MQAVVFQDGDVTVQERADPSPAPDEVVVQVAGAGINGADLLQLSGNYPPPAGVPADQPGLEFAGTVSAVGDRVTRWAVGDAAMGIVPGAAQATLVAVHEDLAQPVPDGLDPITAGGLPEALVTAHDALATQGDLHAGDRVLVTGAAGGVGTMAVQLAAGMGGDVVASIRGTERAATLQELGATTVVEAGAEDQAGPFDLVLELVGGASLAGLTRSLAPWARIVVIGVAGGGPKLDLNLLHLMRARATLRGSTLRARPLAERLLASRRAATVGSHLHRKGRLVVPVHARHDLADAADAYAAFRTSGTIGKVLLTP